jgi:kynureninase
MTTAADLDAADELAAFADEFAKPPGVYMDGNSLGLMCHAADASLREAIEAWRTLAIRGWTEGDSPWFTMSRRASALLAPLLGCEPDDVMVGNSTTVNLHQILATFRNPAWPDVLIDGTHFPTDRYAVESHLRVVGDEGKLCAVAPGPNHLLDEPRLIDAIAYDASFAILPSVVYTTGQLLDVMRVTEETRRDDFLLAWDCSHSAGVVPHHFRRDEIDLAFGCGYKYLNGGPGAAAWLYVHPRLRDKLPGLAGWFGSDPKRQFEMSAEFHPAADANRYQIGTPNVFSLAPLLGSLQVLNDAGIDRIRAKSIQQTTFLMVYAQKTLARHGVTVVTPEAPHRRGGHVTLAHPDAAKLSRALRARGVVPDFRPPDMLRFAPAPLYTSFAECEAAIDALDDILTTHAHLNSTASDELVT